MSINDNDNEKRSNVFVWVRKPNRLMDLSFDLKPKSLYSLSSLYDIEDAPGEQKGLHSGRAERERRLKDRLPGLLSLDEASKGLFRGRPDGKTEKLEVVEMKISEIVGKRKGTVNIGKTVKASEIAGEVQISLKPRVMGKYNQLAGYGSINGISIRTVIDLEGLQNQYGEELEEALSSVSEVFSGLLNTILAVIDPETEITSIRAEVTRRLTWCFIRTKDTKVKAEIGQKGLRVYQTKRIAKNKSDELRNVQKDFDVPEEVPEKVKIVLSLSS